MGLHFVGFKMATYALRLFGVDCPLSALTAPAGDSIGLLVVYAVFGVLFPLVFMTVFRWCRQGFGRLFLSKNQ